MPRLFEYYAFPLPFASGHVSTEKHLSSPVPMLHVWPTKSTCAGHLVEDFSSSMFFFFHQQYPNFPLTSSLLSYFQTFR